MKDKNIKAIFEALVERSGIPESQRGDLIGMASKTAAKVSAFLQEAAVITGETSSHDIPVLSRTFGMESFAASISTGSNLSTLAEQCNVPKHAMTTAIHEMALIMARASESGAQTSKMVSSHFSSGNAEDQNTLTPYYSMLPSELSDVYGKVGKGLEYFGADTNKAEADLVTAITITLMRFHGGAAHRLMHTISSTNPLVRYTRDEYNVIDLASSENNLIPVLALADDPSPVTNALKKIVPQAAHDDITHAGYLPINKTVNLFSVGQTTAYGNETFNRTDFISDDLKISALLFTLAYDDGAGDAVAAEEIRIAVPSSLGRLHRLDDAKVTARGALIRQITQMPVTQKNVADGVSANVVKILGAGSTDKLMIEVRVAPSVDISSGVANMQAVVLGTSVVSSAGAAVAKLTLANLTVTLTGVELDARYSEENMRKASIVATNTPSTRTFVVPSGRFYTAERSHQTVETSEDRARQIALLQQIGGIGQDDAAIKVVLGVIDNVKALSSAYAADPINNIRPNDLYVAGGKVNPIAIFSTLDLSGIDAFDDSRLIEAVKARVRVHMSAVITDLLQISKLKQQTGDMPITFRALCSGEMLGKIIGVVPSDGELSNGAEYAMELAGGIRVEFVTSTFSYLGTQIILLPYFSTAAESELNFGHNRNVGTVVLGYTASQPTTGSAERLTASIREAALPTNPVAAVITVTSIPSATFGYAG